MKTNERTINMKKSKNTIKRIYKIIIDSIRIIFKDPFPFPKEDNKSETDKERK